jgi:hypothetical protein
VNGSPPTRRPALELFDHPADRHGRGFDAPEPRETFTEVLATVPFERLLEVARDASAQRVERALAAAPIERTMGTSPPCCRPPPPRGWRIWPMHRTG